MFELIINLAVFFLALFLILPVFVIGTLLVRGIVYQVFHRLTP